MLSKAPFIWVALNGEL